MAQSSVKAVPDGMHTVTPYLTCDGASDAIAFYIKAFDAVEINRMPDNDGKIINAMIRIGDSALMVMDEYPAMKSFGPKSLNGSPVTIHLQLEDIDGVVAKAVAAGATLTMPAADMFWGDRYAALVDPFGHVWSVATHIRDVGPDEMRKGAAEMQPTA